MTCPTCGGPQLTERPHIHLGDVTPPSQPPGWVDPDPLHVEAEPVRRHVRYQGWHRDSKPIRHEFALVGLGVCFGIVIFALLFSIVRQLDPAPSSGQTTEPVDVSRPSSAALSGASVPPSSRDPEAAGATATPETAQPSPGPTGEIGTALVGGWATYYATCSECAAAGPLLQAALGPHWKGSWVTVESDHGKALLRLVTSCACGDRTRNGVTRPTLIDVSLEAFGELSPSPAGSATDPGFVAVSIEVGARPTLPPTDDDRMRLEVRDDDVYR